MKKHRKAVTAGVVLVVAALVAALGAWAYFSGSGSDSDGAQIGAAPIALTVTLAIDPGALYPGNNVPLTVSVSNASGSNSYVGQIEQSGPVTGLPVDCDAAWFSMAAIPVDQPIADGGALGPFAGSLAFADSGTNQDACSNGTPTLSVALAP